MHYFSMQTDIDVHDLNYGQHLKIEEYLKNHLLQKADEAFRLNDRSRCSKLIEQLYDVFDDEQSAY